MQQQGASIKLIVPRLYSPPWLNKLLGRPDRMNHLSSLAAFPGIDCHSVTYFARPGRSFKRRAGQAMYRASLGMANSLHQRSKFDVVYGTDWYLGVEVARRIGLQLDIPSAGLAIGDDLNVTANQSAANYERFVKNRPRPNRDACLWR